MANVIPSELAQLRDIHLPDAVAWWPLAPGWYGLALIILVASLSGAILLRRYIINGRAKHQALAVLLRYQQEYKSAICLYPVIPAKAGTHPDNNAEFASGMGPGLRGDDNEVSEKEIYQDITMSAQISALLKRVALVYFPRARVASLQGESWVAFLNSTSKKLDFNLVRQELILLPYLSTPYPSADLNLLFNMARQWIKQRSGPCLS